MRVLSDRTSFNIRRSTGLMIGGGAAVICGCIGALLWTLAISASSVDSTAVYGEKRLLDTIIDTYQSELSKTVIDYSTWDDLFDNFSKQRHPQWEAANLGPSITRQLGVDYVIVSARNGDLAYIYGKARQGPLAPSPADLARIAAIGKRAFAKPMPKEGVPVSGTVMFDGTPGLIAASPIVSSRGETPGFALIEIRSLNAGFLARMSKGFGVAGLKLVRWNGDGLPLQSAHGDAPEFALAWTTSNAGQKLFAKVLPTVIGTGLLLLVVFSALLMLWRTIVEHMRASEARALTAEIDAARARAVVAEETARNKNAFIANMNHELRTPLNAIIGFSEIIQSEAFGPIGAPKYREYIHDINESGNHLLGIINDILLVSKVDAGKYEPKLEPVPLHEVMSEVVRMMEVIAAKRAIWINTIHCATHVTLLADRQALRQVLLNVLSNAVKFSPEGYGIDVEGGETADGNYELRVVDYGCGIPPETLKDVGKPFVQAETAFTRNYQGTGLGLSICYRLVAAMGGRIEVNSKVNVGTTVRLTLNMIKSAQAHTEVA